MDRLEVRHARGRYDLLLGSGLLPRAGRFLAGLLVGRRGVVITHPSLAGLYAGPLAAGLAAAGFEAPVLEVPAGEASKSLGEAAWLYEALLDLGLDRRSPVFALGGGVIGDLAGYVAATFMRGLPLVQVPTTLLAQVDSSIGGKVGVNLPRAKNMVGAFHPPVLVLADLDTLATLPAREYRAGLAEVVKAGVIRDPDLLAFLEAHLPAILRREPGPLATIVRAACAVKAAVVEADEREEGLRAILNYGHTVGHALEAVAGYGTCLHGEAVAVGMVVAARLSARLGLDDGRLAERLIRLLEAIGLPTTHDLPTPALLAALRYDKKGQAGTARFVLTSRVGQARVQEVSDVATIAQVLDATRSAPVAS
jgi:3-dehydroquinate synthase